MSASECTHVWIANSGQGGEPEFQRNRQMSAEPLMHVMCERCKARTWITEKRWNAMQVSTESRKA